MKKNLLIALLTGLLTLCLSVSGFASTPVQPGYSGKNHVNAQHFRQNKCQLKSLIADSLKRNNGDISKVKQDVAKIFADKKASHDTRLNEIAKKKGITVQELKDQLVKKHTERMTHKAAREGISVAELKKRMEAKHTQRLEKMANELGLTADQLKQILPSH